MISILLQATRMAGFRWCAAAWACLVMLSLPSAHGGSSDVVMLDSDNFGSTTKDGIWWCGHCKRVAPVWEKVATALKESGVRVGKIDADGEAEIAEQYAIQAYPTFKILDGGKVTDFKGQLQLEVFLKFARDYVEKKGKQGTSKTGDGASAGGDVLSMMGNLASKAAGDSLGLYTVCVFGTGWFVGIFCGVLFAVREKEKIN